MENLWKLLEKASGIDELHHLASEASDELIDLKNRVETLEKKIGGEEYVAKEFPKMLADGTTVWSAEEEAKATGQGSAELEPAPFVEGTNPGEGSDQEPAA